MKPFLLALLALTLCSCGRGHEEPAEHVSFQLYVPDSLRSAMTAFEQSAIASMNHNTGGRDNPDQAIEEMRKSAEQLFGRETIGICTYSDWQSRTTFIPYALCNARQKAMCDSYIKTGHEN